MRKRRIRIFDEKHKPNDKIVTSSSLYEDIYIYTTNTDLSDRCRYFQNSSVVL